MPKNSLNFDASTFGGILQNLPDAVLMIDANGKIFYTNPAADEIFGFAPDAKNLPEFTDILTADSPLRTPENLAALCRKVAENGFLKDFEAQLLDKDGKNIEVNLIKTVIHEKNGKPGGFSIIVRDVTKTREGEQRISRRNAQLFALIDVAEAITQMTEVESLLGNILNAVLRVMNLRSGCVHLLNEENESLELAVQENLTGRVRSLIKRFELGEGVIGQTAVLGETLLVDDTALDRRVARPISNEKIGSLATVPLIGRGGIVRGVLTLFHDAPRSFTAHEKSMLTGIGKQVGVALERAELLGEVTDAQTEWEETFDAMTDGVSIHAPSGKIRRANASLAQMFGETAKNLVGIRCCELYHNSKTPRHNCTIMRTVTERQPQKVELTDRLHGRVLRIITDPIINPENRVIGVVCTTRDVTDEKLIERRLIQQERISAIGEITAGIAHEVGTPLNIISANLEFLLRSHQNLQRSEEITAIREQTSNITNIVTQLLDFSRNRSPELAAVNINELIKKTVGLLNHQLQNSGVKTDLQLAPYLPTVEGDASQIQQVLFNLITNARQATDTNENREKTLNIVTDTAFLTTDTFSQPHIVITISDNGRGIPDDALPNVFNPFFTANKEGGTGLGLAISHRIVQRHHGTLIIENNPTNGVAVKIRLPLGQS